jgi:hypothetical protein
LFETTLADMERVLGADHLDALTTRNDLAKAYEAAGRDPEAIPLLETNLASMERVLRADRFDTLGSPDDRM